MTGNGICIRCKERPVLRKSWCRECQNAYGREWRNRNIERARQQALARYYAHPEKWKAHTRKYRLAHPERVAAWHRGQYLRRRGITAEDYDRLMGVQEGACALCGAALQAPRIDHDHACCSEPQRACRKCIRGLLCGGCNRSLGWYEARPDAVARYLAQRPLG